MKTNHCPHCDCNSVMREINIFSTPTSKDYYKDESQCNKCHKLFSWKKRVVKTWIEKKDFIKDERCMLIVKNYLVENSKKKNFDKLIKNLKNTLAEYNSTKPSEKICLELKGDYIPFLDQEGNILGGLY